MEIYKIKNARNKSNQYFLIRLLFVKSISHGRVDSHGYEFWRAFRDGKVAANYGHTSRLSGNSYVCDWYRIYVILHLPEARVA